MFHLLLQPLLLRIAEECAEKAGIKMVEDGNQEMLVELECVGELAGHLPDTIDELQKHRRTIGIRMPVVSMTNSLGEFMAKT